jgi:SAM-dependent methyltransferase
MAWTHSELIAEVYDFDLPLGHTVGDIEYYTRALADIRGPILEPACGTGRMLIPLLEAGHNMEGADRSPEMLDVCRRHCRARGLEPVLHAADMASFVQPETYSAIILPAGSIRNLDGREAALQALNCFSRSLIPGGLLLLDVIAPRFVTELGPMQYWRRDPYLWTRQTVLIDYDPVANRTTKFQRYEKWRDGDLLTTELHRFCLQHWGLREFEELLGDAGFTDVSVIADFQDGERPKPDSGDWTFRACRR